jgi:hypothetical protein
MAIAYQSIQVASDRNATPLTITKPTGLAAGDLMIAYLSCSSGSGAWTLPANWTSVVTGTTADNYVAVFAKYATAGDAAASNFSFTGTGDSVGLLLRFSGNFNSTLSINKSVINMAGITTTGVDPDFGGALVMFGSTESASTGSPVYSAYSVATDNPTWTEIIDDRYDDLVEIHFFAAWGLRSQSTATGASSVTESVGGTNYGGVLLALVESTGADGNHTILTSTSDVFDSGLSVGTTATHSLLDMNSTIGLSSGEVTAGTDIWQLTEKNTGSWTLDNKS